jgi:hypothetical protein
MSENEATDAPDPDDFVDDSPNPQGDTDLAILCDALQERGVQRVVVQYEGSGDSGGIELIEFEPADPAVPAWLEKALHEVAEGYCPDGYENNEGGYGTLTIHPFLGRAALEHYDRSQDAVAMDLETIPLPEQLRQGLSALGVHRVTAHFDGCGDDGQFDPLEVEPESAEIDDGLQGQLEDFLLERLPGGWELNEGSIGHFEVDVPSGAVTVDGSYRTELGNAAQQTRWKWRP